MLSRAENMARSHPWRNQSPGGDPRPSGPQVASDYTWSEPADLPCELQSVPPQGFAAPTRKGSSITDPGARGAMLGCCHVHPALGDSRGPGGTGGPRSGVWKRGCEVSPRVWRQEKPG